MMTRAHNRWLGRATMLLAALSAACAPAMAQRRGGDYAPVARFRQEPVAAFDRSWGEGRPGEERAFVDRHVYRDGRYGRIRCRDSGSGSSLLGAIAGGLIGGPGPRDGMTGPVNGAGAMGGRAIDRGC